MWKRDHQLVDVYGRKSGFPGLQQQRHSKDDSILVQSKSLYTLPSVSHSQPCLEVYTRKIASTGIYQGNEFDVFSSSDSNNVEESMNPTQQPQQQQQLEKREQPQTLPPQPPLQLQASESTSSHGSIKRTSIHYLIDKDVTKKRRTTITSTTTEEEDDVLNENSAPNDKSMITGSVFIKSTAPANTPANIFMIHPEAEQSSYDLEYC